VINKCVYPLINKLSEEAKPECMLGLKEFVKICKIYAGEDFVECLKPKAVEIY
jgi:hypothetical protein